MQQKRRACGHGGKGGVSELACDLRDTCRVNDVPADTKADISTLFAIVSFIFTSDAGDEIWISIVV